MQLDERKKRILQAIVSDYIETAEPVGSRTIAKRHMAELSSATIRNEMADLEELGYLQQPHTSAGRVPSDMGYRLYVDSLMERYRLTVYEMARVSEALDAGLREFDRLLAEASVMLSRLTNYTSLAILPEAKGATLKAIQLVGIDARRVMLILVTDEGLVKNTLIPAQEELPQADLLKLNTSLSKRLTGICCEQMDRDTVVLLHGEFGRFEYLLGPVLNFVNETIKENSDNIKVDGMSNILSFPEYATVERARDIMAFLDDKRLLHSLIAGKDEGQGDINIIIGNENPMLGGHHCSVVFCNYRVGRGLGRFGVIGPTRMDYPKVVSTLEYMAKHFNRAARRLFAEGDEGGDG